MSAKRRLIEAIMTHWKGELETMTAAAKAAHEAATHEESKAEDSHDTRGLEASYLAAGQTARIDALRKAMITLQLLNARDFSDGDAIGLGALVTVEVNGKKSSYFLITEGGGVSVPFEGKIVQVITPRAPLGEALMGRSQGESVEIEAQNSLREYEIVSVS